ncbi:acetyl-CoA acetyltransferase family protein [Cytobacillus purgationiresistens]|uniref:Acetyl-CoA acetyltransferase family protein n=1 Tax=Cytobacillus purgationiresistens TaxID=863449 RepID=A0ABU0ACA0_9BACI|nr:acetyl-CoA acetyltransferase family protein [Cytobacillus purgationiresistens]
MKEVVKRAGISASLVEDVIFGCIQQVGEQGYDIARVAALIADYPIEVPGVTVERQCGSGQQAIHFAAQAVLSGDMDVLVAGGVESMSRIPIGSVAQGAKHSNDYYEKYEVIHQGDSAERIADQRGYTRTQLDEFSLESNRREVAAIKERRFEKEIVPVEVTLTDGTKTYVSKDEGPRADTSIEKLGKLKTVFKEDRKTHAGNSSQISDGASVVLIMSREKAEELGLKPHACILARSVVRSDRTLMLTGPIAATKKELEKAKLTLEDMAVYEVNEAFAPGPLILVDETGADQTKMNPNGGNCSWTPAWLQWSENYDDTLARAGA